MRRNIAKSAKPATIAKHQVVILFASLVSFVVFAMNRRLAARPVALASFTIGLWVYFA